MNTGKPTPRNPYLAVDAAIEYENGIVLVKRKNPPIGWAFPGGFVKYGETVEAAVKREVREETGLRLIDYEQWKVFSEPDRDPRQHVVSVCFVGQGRGKLVASTDAEETALWQRGEQLPRLVFDHQQILMEYLEKFSKGGEADG